MKTTLMALAAIALMASAGCSDNPTAPEQPDLGERMYWGVQLQQRNNPSVGMIVSVPGFADLRVPDDQWAMLYENTTTFTIHIVGDNMDPVGNCTIWIQETASDDFGWLLVGAINGLVGQSYTVTVDPLLKTCADDSSSVTIELLD